MIEYGLTSPSTQYRLYGRRFLQVMLLQSDCHGAQYNMLSVMLQEMISRKVYFKLLTK